MIYLLPFLLLALTACAKDDAPIQAASFCTKLVDSGQLVCCEMIESIDTCGVTFSRCDGGYEKIIIQCDRTLLGVKT